MVLTQLYFFGLLSGLIFHTIAKKTEDANEQLRQNNSQLVYTRLNINNLQLLRQLGLV